MALDTTGAHPTPFALIDHGNSGSSNFSTGGTNLGLVLSQGLARYQREGKIVTRPLSSGLVPWEYRWLGDVATFQVVLGQRASAVLKFAHRPLWISSPGSGLNMAGSQIKPGRGVREQGLTSRLQVRAMNDALSAVDTDRPHLYMPHAFCIDVEAIQWSIEGRMLEAAVLTILAIEDTENSLKTHYEGDIAHFPSIA